MSVITREDVLKLAKLSKLQLTEDEVLLFVKEFASILAYVEQLKDVDVTGLEPTYQVTGLSHVTRKDILQFPDAPNDYEISVESLMKNAPSSPHNNQFSVKRVL